MKFIILPIAALMFAASQPSPSQAIDLNPLSMIKGAVEAAVEDRSSEDIGKDLAIKTEITAKVIEKLGTGVISISADVYEQDVMLTGSVEKIDQKVQAGKLSRSIQNVQKIYNKKKGSKTIDKKKSAAENFFYDTVI